MSNTPTPDLITTHKYVVEAVDYLGDLTFHDVVHKLGTRVMEATSAIPEPHVLEATVKIPVKQDPETEQLLPSGEPRTLTLELYSDFMPRRTGFHPGSITRFTPDSDMEQRQLARSIFKYNTKRLIDSYGEVQLDGENIGIDLDVVTDPSNKNFLLSYLAAMSAHRSLNPAHAADFVAAVSMNGARTIDHSAATVDIHKFACKVSEYTGIEIPKSLNSAELPQISFTGKRQLSSVEGTPTISINATAIDSYDHESHSRIITDWLMTQYNGFTPIDPQHLAFYEVLSDNEAYDGTSFGIDARTRVTGSDPYEAQESFAKTFEEARDMVGPLVRAVSNLRRYRTNALAHSQQGGK